MQAQSVREDIAQDVLTSQQSLQSIQTLLRAGLGCITYLRNLLPADNFSESYLTSANSDVPSSRSTDNFGSFSAENGKRNVSGFKIMTVTRGYTEEADKLLDFLESGIFDALQHQYLRSFIFAIYLDNNDPNNIVEAYTFNFWYYSIPGTKFVVPVMSLGEDLMKMSISDSGRNSTDPIADATRKGRVPTLGEVKKSLKTLIKNLIQATTQMDPLPRRRYATFKLFYHDHTPDDYEPPHFRAGDAKKDRWFFTTHDCDEMPEKCSVGTVQTGWHGVDVRVASVSGYLPSLEDNSAPFLGTTTVTGKGPVAPPLTPAEEAAARAQQAEVQRLDASERRVVWDAEGGCADADADGEAEDESNGDESQIIGIWRMGQLGLEFVAPIGIRDADGNILPLPQQVADQVVSSKTKLAAITLEEGLYVGAQDDVPSRVGELAQSIPRPENIEQTQQLEFPHVPKPLSPLSSPLSVPPPSSPSPASPSSPTPIPIVKQVFPLKSQFATQSLPPSDIDEASIPSVSSVDTDQPTIDTQALDQLIDNRSDGGNEDQEMLDLETQVVPSHSHKNDSIASFSVSEARTNINQEITSSANDTPMAEAEDHGGVLECECGVLLEDNDVILCDGVCNRWFHVWCMGHHEAKDLQGDVAFVCFDCRVRADQHWDLIVLHDLYQRIMERFGDLALFRRAIKVYETHNPPGLSAFVKLIGCEGSVAGQLFRRLESEGFIAQEIVEQDDMGLMETNTRKPRGKKRGSMKSRQSNRIRGQKSRYVYVDAIKTTQAYVDYFSPDPLVEKRILGLSDLKPKHKPQSRSTKNNLDQDMYEIMTFNYTYHPEAFFHPGRYRTTSISQDMELGNGTGNLLILIPPQESQTQEELDLLEIPSATAKENATLFDLTDKRKNLEPECPSRQAKKMKISVGLGVDLGD